MLATASSTGSGRRPATIRFRSCCRPPGMPAEIGRTAAGFPSLRIAIDHMGLRPFHPFSGIAPAVTELLPLSDYSNVTVKATALPISVRGPYPFRAATKGAANCGRRVRPRTNLLGLGLDETPMHVLGVDHDVYRGASFPHAS